MELPFVSQFIVLLVLAAYCRRIPNHRSTRTSICSPSQEASRCHYRACPALHACVPATPIGRHALGPRTPTSSIRSRSSDKGWWRRVISGVPTLSACLSAGHLWAVFMALTQGHAYMPDNATLTRAADRTTQRRSVRDVSIHSRAGFRCAVVEHSARAV